MVLPSGIDAVATPGAMTVEGKRLRIRGTVQGVGFRPFVYRIARDCGLAGRVYNDAGGVMIEAFGTGSSLRRFEAMLRGNPPPLSVIRSFDAEILQPGDESGGFRIEESRSGERVSVDVARDTALCPSCFAELFSPDNRRHRHPFINCTDCGPRYTIIRGMPYDRPATTMAGFDLCADCREEYESPGDRRFHAQPVCCNRCGPRLQLLDGDGNPVQTVDAIRSCIDALASGSIIAIKGIGGFHLACRADRPETVASLRRRKYREEKPFAVMVRNADTAAGLCRMGDTERRLLQSPEAPIVIMDRLDGSNIASEVAPRVRTRGIMLPYAPVHFLLFEGAPYEALVMTSANRSDEPICSDNEEALTKLRGIADAFLVHNRPIHVRLDDSIVRMAADNPVITRRARGYVPDPISAGCRVDGIIGLGGILKGSVTVGRGEVCYPSQYLGAVDNLETLSHLETVLSHLISIVDVKPRQCVVDRHPRAMTRDTARTWGVPVLTIQHHHAHAVACLAENGVTEPALCVVFDGAGYGDDGTTWGGEILFIDRHEYRRAGMLDHLRMPGGDAAALDPGRMALGALYPVMGEGAAAMLPSMPAQDRRAVLELLQSDVNCPKTSSMGRLFDSVSCLLGVCTRRTYEGQPAIELEGCADPGETGGYDIQIEKRDDGAVVIPSGGILERIVRDLRQGTPAPVISARFHNTVARATARACADIACRTKCRKVGLSGGCFQNRLLLERTAGMLTDSGLDPVLHRLLPPNDECVSYGQVVIAGRMGALPRS